MRALSFALFVCEGAVDLLFSTAKDKETAKDKVPQFPTPEDVEMMDEENKDLSPTSHHNPLDEDASTSQPIGPDTNLPHDSILPLADYRNARASICIRRRVAQLHLEPTQNELWMRYPYQGLRLDDTLHEWQINGRTAAEAELHRLFS